MADIVHERGVYGRDTGRERDDATVLGAILRRTSWGAIIAGAVAAISTQMILTLLGIAIGATASDIVAGPDRVHEGVKTTAAAWWLITGTLAMFVGGCVVGRFTGMSRSPDVMLHGFTMWAVTALFGFLVVTAGAGALYGTSLDATYAGTRAMYGEQARSTDTSLRRDEAITVTDSRRPVTQDEAQRYVRATSWLSLFGLGLGIAAALGGSWLTAPNRIIVRSPSESVSPEPRNTR